MTPEEAQHKAAMAKAGSEFVSNKWTLQILGPEGVSIPGVAVVDPDTNTEYTLFAVPYLYLANYIIAMHNKRFDN